jgi:hypothetical protein
MPTSHRVRDGLLAVAFALTILTVAGPTAALAKRPGAQTGGATNITEQSATLKASINPNGKPTQFFFEYGQTQNYGQHSPTQGAGSQNRTMQVGQNVGGLKPNTQYHYRVVATNADGTRVGRDRKVTTRRPDPNALLLTETPNPVLFGHSASLTGQLRGPRNTGVGITLMARPASSTGAYSAVAGPVPTDANGNFSFSVLPGANTAYHVVSGTQRHTTSADVGVGVVFNVKLRVNDRHPRRGQAVTFSGSVFPGAVGSTVAIQRQSRSSGEYVTVASAGLTQTSEINGLPRTSFSRRIHVRSSGIYRAVMTGTNDLSEGASRRVGVHVR